MTSLSIPHLHVLKLAAKLVDPALLTPRQQQSLLEAVEVLVELIADSHRGSEREDRFAALYARTHAAEDEIGGSTTMAKLAGLWIAEIAAEGEVKLQTVQRYLEVVRIDILPVFGHLQVKDVTVGTLDRFLKHLVKEKVSQARVAKVVLNQMLRLAVRHGALIVNPIREIGRLRKPRREIRVLTIVEVERLRSGIAAREDRPPGRSGPKPNSNLANVVDLMLATGARIGEICALRWCDVNLYEGGMGTVTICGTMIFVKGQGWKRQEVTKSEAGYRTIYLPRFAIEMLLRRRPSVSESHLDAVFASRSGSFLQPDNIRRDFRKVRNAIGLEWVTPHVFRKTVATLLHEDGLDKAATLQLGHSGEEVTRAYYVAKPKTAPDVSEVLERLGPGSGW